eukprot:GHVU01022798.1.p1 GENE.GHVU01022798.1~~GHVU01022798.1.p1  ORF type:complete len:405 (-),score=37.46 GHVU01022798.1:207-1421(-)
MLWRPAGASPGMATCMVAERRCREATGEEIVAMHGRLFHPSADRLAGTLREQGLRTTPAVIKRVVGPCTVCAQKNGVYPTPPRRTARGEEGSRSEDTMGWDLAFITDWDFKGERHLSLFVHEDTLLWHANALKKKSDAPDHLLEVIHESGPFAALRSDNAGELKGFRVQVICKENNIVMLKTPPYSSAVNGICERAIREFRLFLAVIIHELGLPRSLWPALLPGICELHNVSYSPVLKQSPWLAHHGFPPRLSPIIGDYVVLCHPSQRQAPKTLELRGKEMVYLGTLNPSTSIVYDSVAATVIKVHPSQLLSFRARGERRVESSGSGVVQPQAPLGQEEGLHFLPDPAPQLHAASSTPSTAALPQSSLPAVPPPSGEACRRCYRWVSGRRATAGVVAMRVLREW